MMGRVLSTVAFEIQIARRNRWVTITTLLMAVFALALSATGSAPAGKVNASQLSVVVASLTTLSVYLIPLVALLMSFDTITGEIERGTLSLILTYPAERWEILAGKFLAHLAILFVAILVGYGLVALFALFANSTSPSGFAGLWRLSWTSVILGAGFLGMGYVVSTCARRTSGAAGISICLWLLFVVLYDLALLAVIVADDGGFFTTDIFPLALLANPADAFRMYNLASTQGGAAGSSLAGAASSIPQWQALVSVITWPLLTLSLALYKFRKITA